MHLHRRYSYMCSDISVPINVQILQRQGKCFDYPYWYGESLLRSWPTTSDNC